MGCYTTYSQSWSWLLQNLALPRHVVMFIAHVTILRYWAILSKVSTYVALAPSFSRIPILLLLLQVQALSAFSSLSPANGSDMVDLAALLAFKAQLYRGPSRHPCPQLDRHLSLPLGRRLVQPPAAARHRPILLGHTPRWIFGSSTR